MLKFRREQIDGFEKFNSTAHARNVDKSDWELQITTQYGRLSFLVIMGPLFPEHPPEIKILARVTHRWVDKDMNVFGHPKLQAWNPNPNTCHLGKIVREIYAEFARNPPMPQQAVQPHDPRVVVNQQPVNNANNLQPSPMGAPQHSPMAGPQHSTIGAEEKIPNGGGMVVDAHHTPLPEIPSKFPLLEHLSTTQLEELRDDGIMLNDMIENMNSTISMISVRDDLYDGIEDLAKKNLARKPELDALWEDTRLAKDQLAAKQAEYQALAARQKTALQRFSLKHILQELDKAIDEAEESSNKIKARYKAEADGNEEDDDKKGKNDEDDGKKDKGKMTTEVFVKEYLKARKRVHMRTAKRERLQEQFGRV